MWKHRGNGIVLQNVIAEAEIIAEHFGDDFIMSTKAFK